MDRNTLLRRPSKRPINEVYDVDIERLRKRPLVPVKIEDIDEIGVEKIFKFRVLLPNGKTVEVKINGPRLEMPLEDFVHAVKQEYMRMLRLTESPRPQRSINWKSNDLHFLDVFENKIRYLNLRKFKPNKWNLLRLQDGSEVAVAYENMWDLTPDVDLLKELPAEYNFETALADLIDNSLQAVWSNKPDERRLISVEIAKDRIIIFDTGPGMDGSEANSIVKWGKMGASLHRSTRKQAIGGKPPYLVPFFGMFGYGGPIASMHLGRSALVSSKTKESKKVYMLHLERDALLSCSSSEQTWKTKGGLRDPTKDELKNSSNRSFTKVEIVELKARNLDIFQLQCKLKDIYFPYIQCDENLSAGRTMRPIEFQVNGIDLAEIHSGVVATTNLLSCNGPDFNFQLHFTDVCSSSQGPKATEEANARVRCTYFPIVQGKESIDTILTKLKEDGFRITENYETFSHVSIRRLGRLLPDAHWSWLPFMDLRQRKGEKAQLLKRCCYRVKCFIETDAGFIPTPSKTDLAHQHPYTTELRNFGSKVPEKDREVHVEIYKDDKPISLQLLDRKYQEWILQMHDYYDEEIDCGEDEPTYVFNPLNKKELCISSDVLRVHKVFRRKGTIWTSGQKIKVLKGACSGCHKANVFVTLEYMILEGCPGDAGGEARIICRPIGLPVEKGCLLSVSSESAAIEIRDSMSLPISVIDSGKCIAMGDDEWNNKLEMHVQKLPASIELLSSEQCLELEVGEGLPVDVVEAGHGPPKDIVAVIRPAAFHSANASKNLDQKYIVKEYHQMSLEINFDGNDKNDQNAEHLYSCQVSPTSHNKFQGLYIFSLKEIPRLFEKAGDYTFLLSLKAVSCKACERRVQVKALNEVGSWKILNKEQLVNYSARAGSCFPPLSLACYDRYSNRIPFQSDHIVIKFLATNGAVLRVCNINVSFSEDKLTLNIKDVRVESSDLDKIRPKYETTLLICSQDDLFLESVHCQVFPGPLDHVKFRTPKCGKQLLPGHIIKDLELEMFDVYGNHVRKNDSVHLKVDGFCFQDEIGPFRKVDDRGYVNLNSTLKVIKGFGETAILSVSRGAKQICKQEFRTESRELRTAFEVPESCAAGSQLENLVFEVVTSEGEVDENFNDKDEYGNFHTLTIRSDTMNLDDSVQYAFRHGRCTVRAIPLPSEEGFFSFVAAHSCHPQLQLSIELRVEQAVNLGHETITSEFSDGNVLLLQGSPALITPLREYEEIKLENSDARTSLLPSHSSPDVMNLIEVFMNDQMELEDNVKKYGLAIGELEENMKMLEIKQLELQKGLSRLLDCDIHNVMDYTSGKEKVMEKIDCMHNSAAAVVCKLQRSIIPKMHHREFIENVLGVVALLATVQSNELSRIFAQYLGEDQMLAIVCKSYSAACAFERNEPTGSNNPTSAFSELVRRLGYCVNGQYLVICLEDVRYNYSRPDKIEFNSVFESDDEGPTDSDPQGRLLLRKPTLSNGRPPLGFIGYAVNMIHLDSSYLTWRTDSGHGLRATLFYRLFGELQVYENRKYMNMAKACIKEGAVALDGGIMRGNGVMSLGYCQPDIQFPVVSIKSEVPYSLDQVEILKQIEVKNKELHETNARLERERKMHEKTMKKFNKARDSFDKFINEKGPLIRNLPGFC